MTVMSHRRCDGDWWRPGCQEGASAGAFLVDCEIAFRVDELAGGGTDARESNLIQTPYIGIRLTSA